MAAAASPPARCCGRRRVRLKKFRLRSLTSSWYVPISCSAWGRRFCARADESGSERHRAAANSTVQSARAIRLEVIEPEISLHHGRSVKTTGDGLLVEFGSSVDALRCASEMQQAMAKRTGGVPPAQRIEFRIGINVGDVVVEDGDIFGDGVNVAARLEGLADPGGICVSTRVQEDAAGRLDLTFDDIGEQSLKNIARSVRVYRVRLAAAENMPKSVPVDR